MGIFHVKVSLWKAEQRLVESGCIIVLFNGFSSQYPKHGKAYPTECTAPHHQYGILLLVKPHKKSVKVLSL